MIHQATNDNHQKFISRLFTTSSASMWYHAVGCGALSDETMQKISYMFFYVDGYLMVL
jgi:hypothetical protein